MIKKFERNNLDQIVAFLWNFIKKDFKQNLTLSEEQFKKIIIKETLSGLDFYGFYEGILLK